MKTNSRKIWEKPWDYAEGFIVAVGIAIAGFMLQFSLGTIIPSDFAYPINIIIGALFIVGLLCCHFFFRNNHIVRWLSSVRSTMPALIVLLAIIIILGVTPQFSAYEHDAHLPDNILKKLGWYQMTTSWAFILLSFHMLAILGLSTLRMTTKPNSWRSWGFYLNHIGLFAAYLGGILGSADMQRMTMNVREGQAEWRAMDLLGELHELPIAIELDTFKIEEYLPKLVVINNQTGKILPDGRPESYMYEEVGKGTTLAGYNVEVLEYLPSAAVVQDSTQANVVPFYMEGATTALKIRVSGSMLKEPVEGWVSNGSFMFPHKVLYVSDEHSVAMPIQEVKKYTSHVKVFTEDGTQKEATIEVNSPLTLGNWMIYQYSYDDSMGKYSKISVFELVYDPWIKIVYAGVFMILAGSLFMFIVGPKKNKK